MIAIDYVTQSILIGTCATGLLDLFVIARRRLMGTPSPDYGLVGRWIIYLTRGRFRHDSIGATPRAEAERIVGWTAHYVIGITYAWVLLAIWGLDWARQPTLGPALIVGIGSVSAPFLLMQPGMGAGIASSRTSAPNTARLRSLVMHSVFGVALYAAGWLVSLPRVSFGV